MENERKLQCKQQVVGQGWGDASKEDLVLIPNSVALPWQSAEVLGTSGRKVPSDSHKCTRVLGDWGADEQGLGENPWSRNGSRA